VKLAEQNFIPALGDNTEVRLFVGAKPLCLMVGLWVTGWLDATGLEKFSFNVFSRREARTL